MGCADPIHVTANIWLSHRGHLQTNRNTAIQVDRCFIHVSQGTRRGDNSSNLPLRLVPCDSVIILHDIDTRHKLTSCMNNLQIGRISLLRVALNIIVCLSQGVALKMICTSARMSTQRASTKHEDFERLGRSGKDSRGRDIPNSQNAHQDWRR